MKTLGSNNITSVLSDETKTEIQTNPPLSEALSLLDFKVTKLKRDFPDQKVYLQHNILQDSNTTLPQIDSNTCPKTSEDEDNNSNNIGCAGRVRKVLANAGGWICRQFLERIINNIADAAWDSIVQCFEDMTELDGDNDCDQDE